MNYKPFLLTLLSVVVTTSSFAQANILSAKSPEQIGVRTEAQKAIDNDKPLEYGYVDDRDILFSKMTWEKVILDERVNFPLYYPVDTNNIGSNNDKSVPVDLTFGWLRADTCNPACTTSSCPFTAAAGSHHYNLRKL